MVSPCSQNYIKSLIAQKNLSFEKKKKTNVRELEIYYGKGTASQRLEVLD